MFTVCLQYLLRCLLLINQFSYLRTSSVFSLSRTQLFLGVPGSSHFYSPFRPLSSGSPCSVLKAQDTTLKGASLLVMPVPELTALGSTPKAPSRRVLKLQGLEGPGQGSIPELAPCCVPHSREIASQRHLGLKQSCLLLAASARVSL